jgi:hypothetical protein
MEKVRVSQVDKGVILNRIPRKVYPRYKPNREQGDDSLSCATQNVHPHRDMNLPSSALIADSPVYCIPVLKAWRPTDVARLSLSFERHSKLDRPFRSALCRCCCRRLMKLDDARSSSAPCGRSRLQLHLGHIPSVPERFNPDRFSRGACRGGISVSEHDPVFYGILEPG